MLLQVLSCDLEGADLIQRLQALLNILAWQDRDEAETTWKEGNDDTAK